MTDPSHLPGPDPGPDAEHADVRTAPRRRVLLSGKVVYGAAEMTIDCAISDLSQSGAKVRLSGGEPLIDPMFLVDLRNGLGYRARQAWRRGNLVGLAFTDYYDLRTPPPELPRIVRQLWIDHRPR